MLTVTLYEDNAGQLLLNRDGDDICYDVTGVTDSSFAEDAEELAGHPALVADWTVDTYPISALIPGDDEVEPIQPVATFDNGVVLLERRADDTFIGGFASRKYIGGLSRDD